MGLYTLRDRTVRLYTYQEVQNNGQKESDAASANRSLLFHAIKNFFPALSTANSLASDAPAGAILFKEVSSISFDFTIGVGVDKGISRSFLQPWYMEPAKISLSGASYIGAFEDISNPDTDVEDTYNLILQHFAEIKGHKKKMTMDIANNPKYATKFNGYITAFNFAESKDNPYILKYSITFTGKPDINDAFFNGSNAAKQDILQITATDHMWNDQAADSKDAILLGNSLQPVQGTGVPPMPKIAPPVGTEWAFNAAGSTWYAKRK